MPPQGPRDDASLEVLGTFSYQSDRTRLNRKIAILGERGVGKSSAVSRFVTGKFLTHYSPTIESTHRKAVKCNNLDILAEIVDTAGMDEYSRLSRNASVGVDGYVLVYSITSMASLEKIRSINATLLHMLGDPPSVPRVLVGSMNDLEDLRQVRYTDGDALAQSLGVTFCGEASSKTGANWEEAFQELFQQIMAEIEVDGLFTDAALSDEGSTASGRRCSRDGREREQDGNVCSIM